VKVSNDLRVERSSDERTVMSRPQVSVAEVLVAEPGELADPDLDRPHGREHALLRLVDEELVPGRGLDERMQPGGAQERRADRDPPHRVRHLSELASFFCRAKIEAHGRGRQATVMGQ
jgi:hypothetical protein